MKEALPEIGEEVIVLTDTGKVTSLCRLIRYEGAQEFYWDNHYGGSNIHLPESITHWMLPPAPPEGGSPE